jgi:hypothetical protein
MMITNRIQKGKIVLLERNYESCKGLILANKPFKTHRKVEFYP